MTPALLFGKDFLFITRQITSDYIWNHNVWYYWSMHATVFFNKCVFSPLWIIWRWAVFIYALVTPWSYSHIPQEWMKQLLMCIIDYRDHLQLCRELFTIATRIVFYIGTFAIEQDYNTVFLLSHGWRAQTLSSQYWILQQRICVCEMDKKHSRLAY